MYQLLAESMASELSVANLYQQNKCRIYICRINVQVVLAATGDPIRSTIFSQHRLLLSFIKALLLHLYENYCGGHWYLNAGIFMHFLAV